MADNMTDLTEDIDNTNDYYYESDSEGQADSCKDTINDVKWYLHITVAITGCLANIVFCILLHWKAHVSVTNFLLKWLALMDGLYLAMAALQLGVCHKYCESWNTLGYSIERTIQLASVWSVVVLAVFRYIAICKPFQVHRYLTYSRAYLAVSLCLGGSILVNIPFYVIAFDVNDKISIPWLFHQIYIALIYFSVLYFILPFCVLVVVNACMLRGLYKLNKDSQMANKNTTELQEVTKVVLAIVVVFVLSYASFPLYWIDWYFNRGTIRQLIESTCAGSFFYWLIFVTFPLLNASVNLFIYALLRKSFRENIKTCLPCCK